MLKKSKKQKKNIPNNSYNANKEQYEQQGRNLGANVYDQIKRGHRHYLQGTAFQEHAEINNNVKINNSIDLPTKSEIEYYSNQHGKEEGFISQGNIYGNQGYSNSGDIYGQKEKKYNNYIQKVAKHVKKNIKQKGNNNSNKKELNNEVITMNIYNNNQGLY